MIVGDARDVDAVGMGNRQAAQNSRRFPPFSKAQGPVSNKLHNNPHEQSCNFHATPDHGLRRRTPQS